MNKLNKAVAIVLAGSMFTLSTVSGASADTYKPLNIEGVSTSSYISKGSIQKMFSELAITETVVDGFNPGLFARSKTYFDNYKCNANQLVLIDESLGGVSVAGDCNVVFGNWVSAYTGKKYTKAKDVIVDNIISLKEAWLSGAFEWTDAKRTAFLSDYLFGGTLAVVEKVSLKTKGDNDPAKWRPKKKGFSCTYIAGWIATKWRWNLTIDYSEHNALQDTLYKCSDEDIDIFALGVYQPLKVK